MVLVKTTLELPDDLMRAVKVRALHEGKKLKDAVAELIQRGLAANRGVSSEMAHPKPGRLRRGFVPSTKDIEAAIARGRA